jgi:hypothetical protein
MNLVQADTRLGGAGSQTQQRWPFGGGRTCASSNNCTESYNGTSWTSGGAMNTSGRRII